MFCCCFVADIVFVLSLVMLVCCFGLVLSLLRVCIVCFVALGVLFETCCCFLLPVFLALFTFLCVQCSCSVMLLYVLSSVVVCVRLFEFARY